MRQERVLRWVVVGMLLLFAYNKCGSNYFLKGRQRLLIESIGGKRWNDLSGLIHENYSDRWGHNHSTVVETTEEIFQKFSSVVITASNTTYAISDSDATVSSGIVLQTDGSMLAKLVSQHINRLSKPFSFWWHKGSWRPWDWKLMAVDQPELEMMNLEDMQIPSVF